MIRTVGKAVTAAESIRISALLARAEPAIRAQFEALLATIRSQWTVDYIMRLLERGDIARAFEVVALNATRFAAEVNQTYIVAGQSAADAATASLARAMEGVRNFSETMASFRDATAPSITIAFDQVNDAAVTAMRQNTLRLVNGFSQGQRMATQRALVAGIREGLNPRDQAVMIRNSVGLTDYQQAIVNNYRTALQSGSTEALTRELRDRRFDRTVINAANEGRILSGEQVNRMVERYTERWRNFRAETIARTEALRSVHEGDRAGWTQAVQRVNDAGVKASLVREWVTASDERVRDIHASMDGQQVGFDEPFIDGDGNELQYPGDPSAPPSTTIQCRCAVTTTFRAD